MSQYQTLKLEATGDVAVITLNRPDVRNAFGAAMIGELSAAFSALNAKSDLLAVVLRGEGKSFCAGADLGYMKSMAGFSREENELDAKQLFEMFSTLRNCPYPLIGILQGHVMGGGLGLAAVCDFAYALNGTQFCFTEVKLGLVPAVISPFVLEKMARSAAQRWMLTGEIFDEVAAQAAGLIVAHGDRAEVEAAVEAAIQKLAGNGREAVRECKKLLQTVAVENDWSKLKSLTTQVIAERRVSAEGQEGLRSFLEKREPKWRQP